MGQGPLLQDAKERSQISSATIAQHAWISTSSQVTKKNNTQNKQTCGIQMSKCEDYYLPCLGELSMVNHI
jgi:hypothetical protein